MPTRKELKGIAAGIAGHLVSRNADIDGYWAMGVLYKKASKNNTNCFILNLLTGLSSPSSGFSIRLAMPFKKFLLQQIQKRWHDEHLITDAEIKIEFNVPVTKKHIEVLERTWGEPFTCCVSLTDDLNKRHTYTVYGWCAEHNPMKECRSTRPLQQNYS